MNESSSLTLTCTGRGIPIPHLTWRRDGTTLAGPQTGSDTIGQTVGSQSLSYSIGSADASDSGWYLCTGDRTLIGTSYGVSSSVYVNVQSKYFGGI